MPEIFACHQLFQLMESKLKLSDEVSATGFSVGRVLEMIGKNNPAFQKAAKDHKVVNITAKDISEGKGYCSRVYKTVVDFDRGHSYSFMIKIPTVAAWNEMNMEKKFSEEEKEKNRTTLKRMHNTECDAYELIAGMKASDFPAPLVYHSERSSEDSPGVIVMEDLSDRGAALGVFYSATPEQCCNVARHMADFQTYFDLEADEKYKTTCFGNSLHTEADIELVWKRMMVPILKFEDKDLVNKVKLFIDFDLQKLGKYCLEDYSAQFDCNTFCHGDMWTNNMMIKLNEDGSVSDKILAFIDWQACFIGSPIFDIARFISNCADADVRRDVERKAVDVYFDRLTENYAKHGQKPKFTREQAYEFYDLGFVQEVALLVIMFSVLGMPLRDSKNKADHARMEKLALRLRLAADDAMPIIEKHEMRTRFKLDTPLDECANEDSFP